MAVGIASRHVCYAADNLNNDSFIWEMINCINNFVLGVDGTFFFLGLLWVGNSLTIFPILQTKYLSSLNILQIFV